MDKSDDREQRTNRPDVRTNPKLPVTGEVGSEGGSYAEPTLQVAEFEGDVPEMKQDSEPDKIESGAADVRKYPDEP